MATLETFVEDYTNLPSPLWIFGYGSVCWKPSFPYTAKKKAYIEGFLRRLWQQSTDHRGTPENPGLTATIIPQSDLTKIFEQGNGNYTNMDKNIILNEKFESDGKVYGIAYCIPCDKVSTVVQHMDYRERDGYSRMITNINLIDDNNNIQTVKGLLYIGRVDNPRFMCLTIDDCARTVAYSKGESGLNSDYLLNLNKFLHKQNMPDDYITNLSNKVRTILTLSKSKTCSRSKL